MPTVSAAPATGADRGAGPAGPPGTDPPARPGTDPPVLPAYGGACLDGLVPALMGAPGRRPAWLPAPLHEARQIVLLVLDGLGWDQLRARPRVAPALHSLTGGPITSVAPTTTAVALSSLTMGSSPAVHGMVGYRLGVPGAEGDRVLNALRWTTSSGDARERVPPGDFLVGAPFGGRPVPVVTRSVFTGTGFTEAHLRGADLRTWLQPSSIAVEVGAALAGGAPLVYAYYDGVDKMAHARGLGPHYDAELAAADRIVGDVAAALPPGAALAVTADHGQVDVGDQARFIDGDVLDGVTLMSGEARFRWLHTRAGARADVAAALSGRYGDEAWVRTVDEVDADGWLGGRLDARARARLGDVALVPRTIISYLDPADRERPAPRTGRGLVCRHGSLTAEEMWVPLVATSAGSR